MEGKKTVEGGDKKVLREERQELEEDVIVDREDTDDVYVFLKVRSGELFGVGLKDSVN